MIQIDNILDLLIIVGALSLAAWAALARRGILQPVDRIKMRATAESLLSDSPAETNERHPKPNLDTDIQ